LLGGDADGDAASERQTERHAHAAQNGQHDALAVKIDDAQMLVGGCIRGFETHGQRERVEPRHAARPGSEPAGF